MSTEIGFEVLVNLPYDDALEVTKAELMAEGFGIMTSIDVKATMKEKLDVEFRPYTILGACNPQLAHRALTQDALVGLLLPCNVTVEAAGSTQSIVRIVNPEAILGVGSLDRDPEIHAVEQEALLRLERVAKALLTS